MLCKITNIASKIYPEDYFLTFSAELVVFSFMNA